MSRLLGVTQIDSSASPAVGSRALHTRRVSRRDIELFTDITGD